MAFDFGGLGGGISDIFGGLGDFAEANAYSKASKIAASNAAIEVRTTALNEEMASRKIYQTIGSEKAGTAAAGFSNSGTALDLLRSSTEQGALTKQIIANQGQITAQGYLQESAAYKGMEKAANNAGIGGIIGGVLGAVGSIFSDRRLKSDIKFVSIFRPGVNFYSFTYAGDDQRYIGVMADEVEKFMPEAVVLDNNGFKRVHYSMLGIELQRVQ